MVRTDPPDGPRGEPPKPTETAAELAADVEWIAGAVAGTVATVAMGFVILATSGELFATVAGLYGQAGEPVAGMVAHAVHGAVFGVVFAVALADPRLKKATRGRRRSAVAGLGYGLVLAVVGAGIVLPIWAVALDLDAGGIPYITASSIAWHVVYGLVLGVAFAYLAD